MQPKKSERATQYEPPKLSRNGSKRNETERSIELIIIIMGIKLDETIRKSIEIMWVSVCVCERNWMSNKRIKMRSVPFDKKEERKNEQQEKREMNRKPTNTDWLTDRAEPATRSIKYTSTFLWSIKIKWTINYNPILLIDILLKKSSFFFLYCIFFYIY